MRAIEIDKYIDWIIFIIFASLSLFAFKIIFESPNADFSVPDVEDIRIDQGSTLGENNNSLNAQTSREVVSEEPIDESTYVWEGEVSEPMYLSLPSIGTGAYIESSGVNTESNEVGVPTNTNLVGWFNQSVEPGTPGLSIMSGHFDGPTRAGVFLRLNQLAVGDEFVVKRGDGAELQYRIFDVFDVDADVAAGYLFSQQPDINSQLNLITCGGGFNFNTERYQSRTIVYAELI